MSILNGHRLSRNILYDIGPLLEKLKCRVSIELSNGNGLFAMCRLDWSSKNYIIPIATEILELSILPYNKLVLQLRKLWGCTERPNESRDA